MGRVKQGVRGVVILAIGLVVAGCAAEPQNEPLVAPQVEEEPVQIPEEAQDYIAMHGDRYSDPLATYYAEKAYTDEHGIGTSVIQSYFDEYDFEANRTGFNGEVSPLGFTSLRWALDKEVTDENFLGFFNESIAPTVSNTLNLLARNPSTQQVEVIRHEFINHTGLDAGAPAENLFNVLLSVSTEYGSSSIFEVNPAVIDFEASDQEFSIYDGGLVPIDSVDENGNTVDFSDSVSISIDIESYDNKGIATSSVDVVDLQLTVDRATDYDQGGLGRVGIGSK